MVAKGYRVDALAATEGTVPGEAGRGGGEGSDGRRRRPGARIPEWDRRSTVAAGWAMSAAPWRIPL